jgi:hypothetical protein
MSLVKSFIDGNPYRLSVELLDRQSVLCTSKRLSYCYFSTPSTAGHGVQYFLPTVGGQVVLKPSLLSFSFMLIGGMLDMLSTYRLSECH